MDLFGFGWICMKTFHYWFFNLGKTNLRPWPQASRRMHGSAVQRAGVRPLGAAAWKNKKTRIEKTKHKKHIRKPNQQHEWKRQIKYDKSKDKSKDYSKVSIVNPNLLIPPNWSLIVCRLNWVLQALPFSVYYNGEATLSGGGEAPLTGRIFKNSMDSDGFGWIFIEFYGFVWMYMDLSGFLWIWKDLYGFSWIWMDLYGFVWICMDLYGFVWKPSIIDFLTLGRQICVPGPRCPGACMGVQCSVLGLGQAHPGVRPLGAAAW